MRRLVIKEKGKMWPTVTWKNSQIVLYYLGEKEDEIWIEETNAIDFEDLLLRLNKGCSVFITMKPGGESELATPSTEECCKWC